MIFYGYFCIRYLSLPLHSLPIMDKRLHKPVLFALLLPVYGAFFFVESFFNFEGQTSTKDMVRYAALAPAHAARHFSTGSFPLPSSTHSVRLNKRYTPADVPPCPVFSPAVPSYPLPLKTGIYRDPLLCDFTPLAYTLRGPPCC
jgi:hypothetical protein